MKTMVKIAILEQKLIMLEYLHDYNGMLKMIDEFLKETPNDQELLKIKKEIEFEKEKHES